MKRLARDVGLKLLARRNRTLTPRTEPAELGELIRRLHPRLASTSLVRLGPPGDGGYLIPDDLDGVTACFSPGVSRQSGFEEACAERGMSVFLPDASVEGPAISHKRFHILRKFVGATTNDEFTTLDDWVTASVPESDGELLLQIDVEGYEYEVFFSASDALLRRLGSWLRSSIVSTRYGMHASSGSPRACSPRSADACRRSCAPQQLLRVGRTMGYRDPADDGVHLPSIRSSGILGIRKGLPTSAGP